MTKQITIPFQVIGWDPTVYDQITDELSLSRIVVKKVFDCENVKGESVGELLMCASTAGGAGYTIMDRFTVEIDGKKGSFVAIHGGITDEMRAFGRIVPNSGTGELQNITGNLEFKSDADGKHIIFEYSL